MKYKIQNKKKGAYFIGKALWAKGYRQLLIMLKDHYKRTGENLDIDLFGVYFDYHDQDWSLLQNIVSFTGLFCTGENLDIDLFGVYFPTFFFPIC